MPPCNNTAHGVFSASFFLHASTPVIKVQNGSSYEPGYESEHTEESDGATKNLHGRKKSKLNVGTSLGWEANCRYVSVILQGFDEKCRYVSGMGRGLSGRLWDLDRGPAKCRDVSGMGRELSGRRWDLGRGSAKCRDVSWMKKLLGRRKERA